MFAGLLMISQLLDENGLTPGERAIPLAKDTNGLRRRDHHPPLRLTRKGCGGSPALP